MTPSAYINHEIHNRIRIRIPSKQGDLSYFRQLKESMSHCEKVDRVQINPVTASVLIFHRRDPDSIFDYSQKNGLFKLNKKMSKHPKPPLLEGLFKDMETLDTALRKMSEGTWDLKSTFAASLVGLGLLQVSKGFYLPPAWSLFKDAFNFMSRNRFNPS